MEENGLSLLKQEMDNEEIHLKVAAINRLKTVILSINKDIVRSQLMPYLQELIKFEDDEVLYAIAEQIAKVHTLIDDQTSFLPLLVELSNQSETVVRIQAAKTMNIIQETLTDQQIHKIYAPLILRLAQADQFQQRQTACHLFDKCYQRSGNYKDQLRSKFKDLSSEDTSLIRRACAQKIGDLSAQVDKQHVISDMIPIFNDLVQDDQDAIRVMCLEQLIPLAKHLTKEENNTYTLRTLLDAGEDKSWKVRLCVAKHFAEFTEAYGAEITNNNLVQMFTQLLNDSEPEVKQASIKSIQPSLKYFNSEKVCQILLPSLKDSFEEASAQFKAGVASSLCDLAKLVGKVQTAQNIYPVLQALLKDESSEVKMNVVKGIKQIAKVIGPPILDGTADKEGTLLHTLSAMTNEGQWRVRMAVMELLADLGLLFGIDVFCDKLQAIFMDFINNTAASVREMGIEKSALLAQEFKEDWISNQYIPLIQKNYSIEKKGYNYRISCLKALACVMPYVRRDFVSNEIVPIFKLAFTDEIPNVKFCVCKIINQQRQFINESVFNSQLKGSLQDLVENDSDIDVVYHASLALYGIEDLNELDV